LKADVKTKEEKKEEKEKKEKEIVLLKNIDFEEIEILKDFKIN